jgi:hypothetical protein
MELESLENPVELIADKRPKVPEPPPVRLIAVDDCALTAPAGLEPALDDFYVGLLKFQRDPDARLMTYRAENFDLNFTVTEKRESRSDVRPLGIAVESLADLMLRLNDRQIEFVRQRGITPGMELILLLDPAGNCLEISEYRTVF